MTQNYDNRNYQFVDSKQLQTYSVKFFNMDNRTIQNYISQIVSQKLSGGNGAQVYKASGIILPSGEDQQGGCDCGLINEPIELGQESITLKYNSEAIKGGANSGLTSAFNVLNFISNSVSSQRQYSASKFMDSYVNSFIDKANYRGGFCNFSSEKAGGKRRGRKKAHHEEEEKIETVAIVAPEPQ